MHTRDLDLSAAMMLGMIGALSGPWHGGGLPMARRSSLSSMPTEERQEKRRVAKGKRQARRKAKRWQKG